jgi:hypothetical protein
MAPLLLAWDLIICQFKGFPKTQYDMGHIKVLKPALFRFRAKEMPKKKNVNSRVLIRFWPLPWGGSKKPMVAELGCGRQGMAKTPEALGMTKVIGGLFLAA